jgi:hypothetical protein
LCLRKNFMTFSLLFYVKSICVRKAHWSDSIQGAFRGKSSEERGRRILFIDAHPSVDFGLFKYPPNIDILVPNSSFFLSYLFAYVDQINSALSRAYRSVIGAHRKDNLGMRNILILPHLQSPSS